jgi:hypothetical protein
MGDGDVEGGLGGCGLPCGHAYEEEDGAALENVQAGNLLAICGEMIKEGKLR